MLRAFFIVLLVLLIIHLGNGRFISENSSFPSDRMIEQTGQSPVLEFELTSTTVTCELTYGFLPCTGTVWGYLFLLVVYEYLLSLSQQYISSGSNLFFKMFGTGIFGATFFNVLGIFPQIILLLVSVISGSEDTVDSMAEMSISMLAGSAIMQLTLIWPSVVAFGSYDLSQTSTASTSDSDTEVTSASSNSQNKKPFSLTGYGVRTDSKTNDIARIMLLSMVPFLILQLAQILDSSTATRIVVLVSLIISVAFVISYNTYQVFQPWIQRRRLQYVMLKYIQKNLLYTLLTDGRPDKVKIRRLFHKIDENNDSYISVKELRALMLGIQIKAFGSDEDDFATEMMKEFDASRDSRLGEREFIEGLSKYLTEAYNDANGQDNEQQKLFSTRAKGKGEAWQNLLSKKKEKKAKDKALWSYTKAAFLIILGTTFLLVNPIMSTVKEFSYAANIPSFLVSYVVLPFAMGFRQAFKAISSARKKTENAVSLTFLEIYSGVFMNNAMGLATFLLVVYIRDLSWNFSTEFLAILIICTGMGLFASFSNKIPFWACILVYLLYPMSLLLMYFLTEVLGWS